MTVFDEEYERSMENRIGNWHDVVDEAGNGSLIAQLKSLTNGAGFNNVPTFTDIYERDLRNRIGNWHDTIDRDGNGSLCALIRLMISGYGNNSLGTYVVVSAVNHYTVKKGDGLVDIDCSAGGITQVIVTWDPTAPRQMVRFRKSDTDESHPIIITTDGTVGTELYRIETAKQVACYENTGTTLVQDY